jgi:abortive infection bacteriophage resistance protein
MNYTKPALTVDQQADQLMARGLLADRALLIARLSEVNYYRLSAYWYPFRKPGTDTLEPGTSLATVWDRYVFDRHLRLLVMDAIERIEVSVRTRATNLFALQHGSFGYLDRRHFGGMSVNDHRRLLDTIREEMGRSREVFIRHYLNKYTSETDLPLWMAVEIMSFGAMLTFFRNLDQHLKRRVAEGYGLSAKVLESWLLTINYTRNLCAHHGRLWNRELPVKPLIPDAKHRPEFHRPVPVRGDRVFGLLTLQQYMLAKIAPQGHWQGRLVHLVETKHPGIPIAQMGFPPNWKDCPIWNAAQR